MHNHNSERDAFLCNTENLFGCISKAIIKYLYWPVFSLPLSSPEPASKHTLVLLDPHFAMAPLTFSILVFALFFVSGQSQFVPLPGGQAVAPGQLFFGANCKSKGCGIQQGPFGPVFFGGGCKSKGCPIPPGFEVPGVPATPLPPAPPVCCTPDGCLNGYKTECLIGALTPRLRTQGFFVASGSCSGRQRKFNCRSAESVCAGNRRRCVFKRCRRNRPGRPRPPRTRPPATRPPGTRPPGTRPRPPKPVPGRKSKHPYPYSRMLSEDEESDEPVVDTDDRYFQLIDRMINISRTGGDDRLPSAVRQFGFGGCKSKSCPFGVFPNGNVPGGGQFVFGGACKSKGCGIVQGPGGPVYFGGACKSKGCPLPPGFVIPTPSPPPAEPVPEDPKLPPGVPPFRPPGRRDCCFARPCETQRICRCVLNQ